MKVHTVLEIQSSCRLLPREYVERETRAIKGRRVYMATSRPRRGEFP